MKREEKITLERPRPLGSGFLLPFTHPLTFIIETQTIDVLRTHRRLVVPIPDTNPVAVRLAECEQAARETLIQRNTMWFKNTLTPDDIHQMFQPLRNTEGFLSLRFSPSHLPRKFWINDQPVADWDDLEKRWLTVAPTQTPERIHLQIVAQGVYLKKQCAEILLKIQHLSVHLESPETLRIDIDEYKNDIETHWANALAIYSAGISEEIRLLESRIHEKEEKRRQMSEVFTRLCRLRTTDPEWNRSIEYLQNEIQHY